ncbi:hypothetical protein BOX15_Mlig021123g3, partial [Macrostomum lignano]
GAGRGPQLLKRQICLSLSYSVVSAYSSPSFGKLTQWKSTMQAIQLIIIASLLLSMTSMVAEACLPLIIPAVAMAASGIGVFAAGRNVGSKKNKGHPPTKNMGCFADSPNKRDMNELVHQSGNMTQVLCTDFCRQASTTYMGLQNGDQCYCANEYGNFAEIPTSKCDKPCAGNPKENCGGYLSNYVIKLAPLETS